jgi:cytochrome c-type biogenesis protein CcmF
MADLGFIALLLALLTAAYSAVSFVVGCYTRNERAVDTARYAFLATCGLMTVAVCALLYSLLSHDFSIAYVANYSSRDMSPLYLVSSLWAGNGGSLLTWAWLLTIFGAVFVVTGRRSARELVPYTSAVIMVASVFFIVLMLTQANPFDRLGFAAADGAGLNPLLENPGMLIHPITLLAGYVGLTIPFAIAVGALATGRLDNAWVLLARRWTLAAWLLLVTGRGTRWRMPVSCHGWWRLRCCIPCRCSGGAVRSRCGI